MRIIEKILIAITLLGLALKLMYWPGGSTLMILGLGLLSMFYVAAAYFLFSPVTVAYIDGFAYNKTSAPRLMLALATGFSLSIGAIGILFRFMHWPGASVMLLVGMISLVPIAIVSVVKLKNNNDAFYKSIAIRSIVFGCLSILLFAFGVLPF